MFQSRAEQASCSRTTTEVKQQLQLLSAYSSGTAPAETCEWMLCAVQMVMSPASAAEEHEHLLM